MNLKPQWSPFVACMIAFAPLLIVGCGRERESATTTVAGSNTVSGNTADNTAGNTTTLALEPNTVVIGYQPSLTAPQPLIGLQEGEFTRRINSVAFQDKVLPSDSAVVNALRAEKVDIVYTKVAPAVEAYLQNHNLVLLGACSSEASHAGAKGSSPESSPLVSVYFTTKKFVQANPNFVRRFVAANRAITDDLNVGNTKVTKYARICDAWSKASGKKFDPDAAAVILDATRFTSDANLKSLSIGDLKQDSARGPNGAPKQDADVTGFLYNPGKA